jgi:Uma2 family endonuclease
MVSLTDKGKPADLGEPAWEIARLFPEQGAWSEWEYLAVTEGTNKFVEFTDGYVEVLAMLTMKHQEIVAYLYGVILAHVSGRSLGKVLFGPLRVRLRPGLIREPDIVFMRKENAARMVNEAWEGADLMVEVVSEDAKSRKRESRNIGSWIHRRGG